MLFLYLKGAFPIVDCEVDDACPTPDYSSEQT